MSIFREIPPTAGWSLSLTRFLNCCAGKTPGSLRQDFKDLLNIPYAQIATSGTVAFYVILETLKKISRKMTVVIPSYICPLVPLAIKRAGLTVEICDVARDSFDYDYQQLRDICSASGDILAILAVHLGGIPVSFEKLTFIAQQYGAFIIEDCAQGLGAQYRDRLVGTLGDFSFFSLARGKGLTMYEGGTIATRHKEHAETIDETYHALITRDIFQETLKVIELLGYSIFYRPQLFWLAFNLPAIFWRLQHDEVRAFAEYFSIDFPMHCISSFRERIAHENFYRLKEEIDNQRRNALFYIKHLSDVKGLSIIKEYPQDRATYPYVTVVFDEAQQQKDALRVFAGKGLGVSRVYVSAIADYRYLKEIVPLRSCPNGRSLNTRAITLSTSTFLRERDLRAVVDIIKGLLCKNKK
ncbi:MAG: DegT/DnrJ/EryC1/StrS family aminotransferase [Candidatus Omnitrophica bacterium]|nr:DegT/DnrJ/EryC1/StrS family aminotransferase [Candidatus Omnitrophota bacterium]